MHLQQPLASNHWDIHYSPSTTPILSPSPHTNRARIAIDIQKLCGLADDLQGSHLPQALVLILTPPQHTSTRWESVGRCCLRLSKNHEPSRCCIHQLLRWESRSAGGWRFALDSAFTGVVCSIRDIEMKPSGTSSSWPWQCECRASSPVMSHG